MADSILAQLKKFLVETNAMSLALGVVIGGAVGKLISSLVDGLIMPIVSLGLPGGDWRTASIVLKHGVMPAGCTDPAAPNCAEVGAKVLAYGQVIGATLDFLIIAFVVFLVATRMLKIEVKK